MSYRGQVWVPPKNTSFTNLNTNSLMTTAAVGSGTTACITAHAGDNLVGQYVAAPSTPYCIIANLVANQGDYLSTSYASQQTLLYGLGFYDGTKAVAAFTLFNPTVTMGIDIYEYTNATTNAGAVFGQRLASGQPTGLVSWYMIRDDGTNIYFYIATDGGQTQPTHWVKLYSQARTSFLSAPTYVGWFVDQNGGSTDAPQYLTLNSWQAVAL